MADTKAKRGDLVVTRQDSIGYGGTRDTTSYYVGMVTSINRAGIVQAYKRPGAGAAVRRGVGYGFGSGTPLIVSQDEINVDRAWRAVNRHSYSGHPGQFQPYDTLDEVKAALRPYRRSLRGT
jgi:hypothetical protein